MKQNNNKIINTIDNNNFVITLVAVSLIINNRNMLLIRILDINILIIQQLHSFSNALKNFNNKNNISIYFHHSHTNLFFIQ